MRVTSPWIEEDTPNQGSTCVKGRFGYDFPQHRDRLTVPLIRKGWAHDGRAVDLDRRVAAPPRGPVAHHRGDGRARRSRARRAGSVGKPPQTGLAAGRATTTCATAWRRRPAWYSAFREATWEEALSLTAQELLRIRDTSTGPSALAALSSAKCSNEDNYALHADGPGRLPAPTTWTTAPGSATRRSVAAMSRALNTSAASGSMREIEEACDVIFIAGANTTETHPVFGALIKRAVTPGRQADRGRRPPHRAGRAGRHPPPDAAGHRRRALQRDAAPHHRARDWRTGSSSPTRTHDFEKVQGRGRSRTRRRWAPKITGIPARPDPRAPPRCTPAGPRTSTLWAMGLTQHATGTDIVASLLNLHARLRHDRALGRGDDPDPRPEQRAGRERRRRHPVRLHRLPAGHRSGQPRRVRRAPGACRRNRSRSSAA